jgi:hypothetical protein
MRRPVNGRQQSGGAVERPLSGMPTIGSMDWGVLGHFSFVIYPCTLAELVTSPPSEAVLK